jgi:hypothetical protein
MEIEGSLCNWHDKNMRLPSYLYRRAEAHYKQGVGLARSV